MEYDALKNLLSTQTDELWKPQETANYITHDILENIINDNEINYKILIKLLSSLLFIKSMNRNQLKHEINGLIDYCINHDNHWVALLAKNLKDYGINGYINWDTVDNKFIEIFENIKINNINNYKWTNVLSSSCKYIDARIIANDYDIIEENVYYHNLFQINEPIEFASGKKINNNNNNNSVSTTQQVQKNVQQQLGKIKTHVTLSSPTPIPIVERRRKKPPKRKKGMMMMMDPDEAKFLIDRKAIRQQLREKNKKKREQIQQEKKAKKQKKEVKEKKKTVEGKKTKTKKDKNIT